MITNPRGEATKWHWISPTKYLFRIGSITASSAFSALINGAPTSTRVDYDNDLKEGSLPPALPDWLQSYGWMLLYNTTRGNYRQIKYTSLASNYITTETSVDDWADNDVITAASQTIASTYSDIDISALFPANTTAILVEVQVQNAANRFSAALHPFETYSSYKKRVTEQQVVGVVFYKTELLNVIDQKIGLGLTHAGGTSGLYLRGLGYTTEV